jgi:hypothetical protein
MSMLLSASVIRWFNYVDHHDQRTSVANTDLSGADH